MCIPVLLAFRRTYPQTRILFLTKSRFAPLPLKVPGVEVLLLDDKDRHKGLLGLQRYSRQIKAQDITHLADLHHVLRSRIISFFLMGSGLTLGRLNKARAEKRALTRAENKIWKPLKSTHQRYAEVFHELGFPLEVHPTDILPTEPFPPIFQSLKPGKKRVGIAPFAAHSGKCYPLEQMKEVVARLSDIPDIQVILFGGGARETEILRTWEEDFEHCISMAGRAVLEDELALISQLDVMVSMDSGNGHLAAMYGIPVISIWGVTHPYTGFAPFGQPSENALTADRQAFPAVPTSIYGNKVPSGYEAAIASIPSERIHKRILQVLGLPSGTRA